MLQLYNKNKKKIAALIECENLCIESILESGDKTLSFYYSIFNKFYDEIEEETYVRTKTDEYVVKAKGGDSNDNKTLFTCKLNIEELEGTTFDRFESLEQNLVDALNLAIVGTGWRLNSESCTNRKKRTIRMTNCSSWSIIQIAKKLYDIEFKFDTFNKVIMLFDRIGEDRGVYFIDSLNLRALQVQGNSYGFYTRIIPTGKNGLTIASVNGGKTYLENKQYSNKTLTYYWKDERYTKPESLKEDALEKLNIMSKPFKSYIASTINLAKMNGKYKDILDYNLGDYIYLISKKNKVKDKHRIVKTKEYPQDHSKDTVELANKALDLSEEKLLVDEMSNTLENITTDNGTVDGSTIDSITTKQIEDFEANVIKVAKLKAILAEIENLHVNKADIQNLNAVIARIGALEATKASITELNAIHAIIQQIKAGKADIADLNAAVAKVGILENKTAVLENALAGNLTADNFKANSITATSGIIAEGAIGSAQISSLSVNKLEAGDITTSKHKIVSADGTIEIVGNQILINRNNVNRVILGEYRKQDNTTEYGLLIRGKDGRTVMFDSDGVHNAGITDGAIDNNKVADNANISGNKLDINSVIREVNNNGTETIKGTKVTVGDRTLDVELSTQKNTITEQGKELSSQKASLTALDNALKFKVDEQVYRDSINTINNNISVANSNLSKATTELNLLKDEVDLKVNKTDIDKTVKEIEDKIKVTSNKISTAESSFIQKTNEIKANVSNLESETTTKIINAKNEAIKESRSIPDTRNDNQPPSWYMKNYPNQTITEFKFSTVVQISGSRVYGTLETTTPWWNASGGYPTQIFRSNSTATFQRHGISDDTWSGWEQMENTQGSQSKANGALEGSKAYTNSQITVVNTKVHNLESGINILKDQIKSKVSQSDMEKNISEINFNDINMILNSSKFRDKEHWSCTNGNENITIENNILKFKFKNYAPWGCYISNDSLLNKPLDVSKEYTVVCKLKASKNQSVTFNICDGNANNYVFGKDLSLTTEWKIFKFTFKPTIIGNQRQFRFITSNLGYEFDLYIEFVKMVEGKITSDSWSIAPDDVIDNIKITDSKISDVSSSVTQLRDSLTTDIRAINSKTQSIETTLNGKASKQEVTAVDSKITTIKADLSSITQRVSSAEVKTNKLNDNIQSLSSRMASAEQKITPTAIINTVSSTIDSKVNSLKNDVNSKIVASGKALENLRNDMNGAFRDGVLTEAEKKDLEKQLNDLEVERNNVLGEVDSLMQNEALKNTNQLIALNNAKKEFIDNHFNLINAIRKAVNLAQLAKPSVPNVSIFKDVKLYYPHFSDKYYPAYPDISVIENHNGEVYLFDAGEKVNQYDVEKYLKSKNIYKIDKVFVTHSHSDHIEGLPYLLDKFGCKELYIKTPNWSRMPAIELGEWKTKQYHEAVINKANSIGAKIIELNSDRTINLTDRTTLRVVNAGNNDYSNYNNISLGFLFEFRAVNNTKRRYFIQADMSYQSENFVGGQNIGKVDILKLGHHGNTNSSSEIWLNYLKPSYSVATLGYPLGTQVKLNAMRCKFVSSKVFLPNDNPNHMSITIDKDSGAITTSAIEHKITNTWYQRDNGDWYYFDSNGGWAHDTSLVINNRRYRFNSEGLCLNPKGDSL